MMSIRSVTRGVLGPVQRGAASFLTYGILQTNAEKQLFNIQREEEEEA